MNEAAAARPRGRRAGASETREAILASARRRFAQAGYNATTIRAVAADAGVDASLVHYFFGTKADLFVAVVEYPVNPAELIERVLAGGAQDVGPRLVRTFLATWDGRAAHPLFALLRSAPTHEQSATLLREFIAREILGRVARALDADQPELRAALCGSQIVGLAMLRYVLRVEPLASADPEAVVAAVGPTAQRYLVEPLSGAAAARDR